MYKILSVSSFIFYPHVSPWTTLCSRDPGTKPIASLAFLSDSEKYLLYSMVLTVATHTEYLSQGKEKLIKSVPLLVMDDSVLEYHKPILEALSSSLDIVFRNKKLSFPTEAFSEKTSAFYYSDPKPPFADLAFALYSLPYVFFSLLFFSTLILLIRGPGSGNSEPLCLREDFSNGTTRFQCDRSYTPSNLGGYNSYYSRSRETFFDSAITPSMILLFWIPLAFLSRFIATKISSKRPFDPGVLLPTKDLFVRQYPSFPEFSFMQGHAAAGLSSCFQQGRFSSIVCPNSESVLNQTVRQRQFLETLIADGSSQTSDGIRRPFSGGLVLLLGKLSSPVFSSAIQARTTFRFSRHYSEVQPFSSRGLSSTPVPRRSPFVSFSPLTVQPIPRVLSGVALSNPLPIQEGRSSYVTFENSRADVVPPFLGEGSDSFLSLFLNAQEYARRMVFSDRPPASFSEFTISLSSVFKTLSRSMPPENEFLTNLVGRESEILFLYQYLKTHPECKAVFLEDLESEMGMGTGKTSLAHLLHSLFSTPLPSLYLHQDSLGNFTVSEQASNSFWSRHRAKLTTIPLAVLNFSAMTYFFVSMVQAVTEHDGLKVMYDLPSEMNQAIPLYLSHLFGSIPTHFANLFVSEYNQNSSYVLYQGFFKHLIPFLSFLSLSSMVIPQAIQSCVEDDTVFSPSICVRKPILKPSLFEGDLDSLFDYSARYRANLARAVPSRFELSKALQETFPCGPYQDAFVESPGLVSLGKLQTVLRALNGSSFVLPWISSSFSTPNRVYFTSNVSFSSLLKQVDSSYFCLRLSPFGKMRQLSSEPVLYDWQTPAAELVLKLLNFPADFTPNSIRLFLSFIMNPSNGLILPTRDIWRIVSLACVMATGASTSRTPKSVLPADFLYAFHAVISESYKSKTPLLPKQLMRLHEGRFPLVHIKNGLISCSFVSQEVVSASVFLKPL